MWVFDRQNWVSVGTCHRESYWRHHTCMYHISPCITCMYLMENGVVWEPFDGWQSSARYCSGNSWIWLSLPNMWRSRSHLLGVLCSGWDTRNQEVCVWANMCYSVAADSWVELWTVGCMMCAVEWVGYRRPGSMCGYVCVLQCSSRQLVLWNY